MTHRVPGRLVAHDRQGIVVHPLCSGRGVLPPGQRQVLAAHVQELAQGDLGRHGVEGHPGAPGRVVPGLGRGTGTR